MDRALLFSHSTMTSCIACAGFVLKGCLEILDLVARPLGLQREQLRVRHTDSIPSDAGPVCNVAESIPSDEDDDAGSILSDADSIPSNGGSIPSDAGSSPVHTHSSLWGRNSVAAVTLLKHCRDAATAVRSQCERVRFNKSL
jgi:hypothetical protein